MVSLILTRHLSCSLTIGGNRGKVGAGAASPETGAEVLAPSIFVHFVAVSAFFLSGEPETTNRLSGCSILLSLVVPVGFCSTVGSPSLYSGKTFTRSTLYNSSGGTLGLLTNWWIITSLMLYCSGHSQVSIAGREYVLWSFYLSFQGTHLGH